MLIPDPILIVGAARSGTSMTGYIVHACGAWIGTTTGLCENAHLKRSVIYDPIQKNGYDRFGIDPLPEEPIPVTGLRTAVHRALLGDHYKEGPWLFKDVKILLMWESWRRAFPAAKWIITKRDPKAIAQSNMKKWHWAQCPRTLKGWQKIIMQYIHFGHDLAQSGAAHRYLDTEALAKGDMTEVQEIVEWCGLDWNEAAAREIVNPDLWHYHSKETVT